MTRAEIEEKVKEFMIDELEIDEETLRPDALLKDDLGIDSLDYVDILVIVDKIFGFKIKPEEMSDVRTLNQFFIVAYLCWLSRFVLLLILVRALHIVIFENVTGMERLNRLLIHMLIIAYLDKL